VLTELRVRELGVVEDLTLTLGPGMTALTGETGAGKTLVVEALHLVLGGRPAPGLVRAGAGEATVEARFVTGESELVLARAVPAAGRSRAWVDGRMATAAALADAARGLVDIHGQHDQQSLVATSAQRRALDAFAGLDRGPRRQARQRLEDLDRRLAALGGDEQSRARELDVLHHQVAEIEGAGLDDPDEEAALAAEEERLADLARHREAVAVALAALRGDDAVEGPAALGAGDLLGRAGAALAGRPALGQWAARLVAAQAELDDVASDLRAVLEEWHDDPERLSQVQARRRHLTDLRRKYGTTLADVTAFGRAARARCSELEHAATTADALAKERAAAAAALAREEEALAALRRAAAPRLAAEVAGRLHDLAMESARLEVSVGGTAGDDVTFLLGANPGEPAQPLSRVASGGELARTMLALRLVAAGGPATMVFDEVDAGVGGAAATALARSLAEVAEDRQVVVVTHLAQVAAFADWHVVVEKTTSAGRTVTAARAIDGAERVLEVSRMLSGRPHSATAQAHAEELLATSTTGGRRHE
jgi:DNA repair protein RecN (Recombination protein N)